MQYEYEIAEKNRANIRTMAEGLGWSWVSEGPRDTFNWPKNEVTFTADQCLWEPLLAELSPLPVSKLVVRYVDEDAEDYYTESFLAEEFDDPGGFKRFGVAAVPHAHLCNALSRLRDRIDTRSQGMTVSFTVR